MSDMAMYPCFNCGWPAKQGYKYCETCDEAPYEGEDRPWYTPYNEWHEHEP